MDEHHLSRAFVGSDASLAHREVVLGDGWYETMKRDSGKYFASDGE